MLIMKKIDWRLLLIVACAFIMATSVVLLTRRAELDAGAFRVVEFVPPRGAAISELPTEGLLLDVSADKVTLTLPGCQLHQFQDTFFMHVFTKAGLAKRPATYVNLDFSLAQLQPTVLESNGVKTCIFEKPMRDFMPQQMIMGQFASPGGRCCDIIWSRSYVFGKDPQAPQ